ncbi:MAG: flagellin [Parvularcula sp.]|jgi:flagellin|nr:flagellin [Parvularcula sp.]
MLLTNASAQVALRALREADGAVDLVQSRISTGLKVASAKDNAAYFLVSMSQRSDNIALRGIRDNLTYAVGAVSTAMAALPSLAKIIDNVADAVVMLETGAAETEITKSIQTQVREAFNIIQETSYNGVNLLEKQNIETFALGYTKDQYGSLAFDTISIQGAGLGIRPPSVSPVATPLPGAIMDFNSTAITGSAGNLNPTLPPNIVGLNIGTNPAGTDQRTFAISFETGDDITREQVIYEEGGNVRGLNISIRNGQLVFGGYNLAGGDPGAPWPYKEVQLSVTANTRYTAQLVLDGNNTNTGTFRAFLDGTVIDEATGVGILYDHPGAIGIGQIAGNAVVNGTVKNDNADPVVGNRFEGRIDKVVAYNRLFSADEFDIITTYLAEDWLPPKSVAYYVGSELRMRDATLIELLDAVSRVGEEGYSTDNALKVLDAAREKMNLAFSQIGSMEKRLLRQQKFLSEVTAAADEGIAALVEADLEEESARNQSFQVRAELARQSLLIANRQPENLLTLFR